MFKSHLQLVEELKQYSSPKSKITRMINSKEIIQIKRGINVGASLLSGKVITNHIVPETQMRPVFQGLMDGAISEEINTMYE